MLSPNASFSLRGTSSTSGDEADWPLVQSVLAGAVDGEGDKYAQIIETSDGFVLYTAGPISSNGKLVGVALVGTTAATFLAATRTQALADVSLYDFSGVPLSSTFAAAAGDDADADLSINDPAIVSGITAGETVRESRVVWGRQYDFMGLLLIGAWVIASMTTQEPI